MTQYYPLTLEDAIAKYQAGDITAKGLVHFYILLRLKPGWKIRLEHKKVCQELGIQKSAFYNAITRLKTEGSIDWEAPQGILVSISSSFRECGKPSLETETESALAESQSTIAETESALAESQSTIAESKSTQASSDKDSSDPSDYSQNSYQLFFNSLSESEKENFEKFVREEWTRLKGEEIISLERFLARDEDIKNWHQRFLNSPAGREAKKKVIASAHDWQNDPRFDEWIWSAFDRGIQWVHENEAEREQRKAFHDWAFATNAFDICIKARYGDEA